VTASCTVTGTAACNWRATTTSTGAAPSGFGSIADEFVTVPGIGTVVGAQALGFGLTFLPTGMDHPTNGQATGVALYLSTSDPADSPLSWSTVIGGSTVSAPTGIILVQNFGGVPAPPSGTGANQTYGGTFSYAFTMTLTVTAAEHLSFDEPVYMQHRATYQNLVTGVTVSCGPASYTWSGYPGTEPMPANLDYWPSFTTGLFVACNNGASSSASMGVSLSSTADLQFQPAAGLAAKPWPLEYVGGTVPITGTPVTIKNLLVTGSASGYSQSVALQYCSTNPYPGEFADSYYSASDPGFFGAGHSTVTWQPKNTQVSVDEQLISGVATSPMTPKVAAWLAATNAANVGGTEALGGPPQPFVMYVDTGSGLPSYVMGLGIVGPATSWSQVTLDPYNQTEYPNVSGTQPYEFGCLSFPMDTALVKVGSVTLTRPNPSRAAVTVGWTLG